MPGVPYVQCSKRALAGERAVRRWGSRVNAGGVIAINSLLPLWLVQLPTCRGCLYGGVRVSSRWDLPSYVGTALRAQCGSRQPTLSSSSSSLRAWRADRTRGRNTRARGGVVVECGLT